MATTISSAIDENLASIGVSEPGCKTFSKNAAGDFKHAIPPPSHGIDGSFRNAFAVLMGKLLFQLIVLDEVIILAKNRA